MSMTEQYVRFHIQQGKYDIQEPKECPPRYQHHRGWIDYTIAGEMIYSHRDTRFVPETFTEGMHLHDYYELLIYVTGDVDYINENERILPEPMSAIFFKPGQMHTARLLSPSRYERYVFYFSPDFFRLGGASVPMTDFIGHAEHSMLVFPEEISGELLNILKKTDRALERGAAYTELLIKSYLIEIFDLLNSKKAQYKPEAENTAPMAQIKLYIDSEYRNITSVAEIANRFFYSREYLSRQFRQNFNIPISEYLSKRRVTESLNLLPHISIADTAYTVGFHSQSAYIAAFKKVLGCLPSEYKAKHK